MRTPAPVRIRDARAAERRSLIEQIEDGLVRAAELGDDVVGFAVLLRPTRGACELDGLFVAPAHMGAGMGRALTEDARRIAREREAVPLVVHAVRHRWAGDERPGALAPAVVFGRNTKDYVRNS